MIHTPPEPLAHRTAPIEEGAEVASTLEQVFHHIYETRMKDVPICNDKLQVRAYFHGVHDEAWLAVLVTPWFINLMMLPKSIEQWNEWEAGLSGVPFQAMFPAGQFGFLSGKEEALGPFRMCSLLSPVLEFEDMETAEITAKTALETLFDDGVKQTEEEALEQEAFARMEKGEWLDIDLETGAEREAELTADGEPVPQGTMDQKLHDTAISRRQFLRGGRTPPTEEEAAKLASDQSAQKASAIVEGESQ